jgi:mitochondrial fission protein ELM1
MEQGLATADRPVTIARAGTRTSADPRAGAAPTVWVLADDKLGHSTQSVGLADALGWPYEIKALHFNALNRVSNRLLGPRLLSLDRRRSAPLAAPWPQLVIATGRRTVPVARWIRAHSHGRTRLVQLGRKGADRAEAFDLSVTCVHFGLPLHPRRIETLAPLTAMSDARLRQAATRWGDLFAGLPRPHVALLVGGTSALHQLNAATATIIARDVAAFAQQAGGSLYVVTSPRTGEAATAALRAGIDGAGRVYAWQPDDANNPYLGCLAVADVLVATGDSESMLAEAAATGKPLYIYDLPDRPGNVRQRLRAWVGAQAHLPNGRETHPTPGRRWLASICTRLLRHGIVRAPRNLATMHAALIDAGHARPFGAPLDVEPHAPLRELEYVADRVRQMLATAGS